MVVLDNRYWQNQPINMPKANRQIHGNSWVLLVSHGKLGEQALLEVTLN